DRPGGDEGGGGDSAPGALGGPVERGVCGKKAGERSEGDGRGDAGVEFAVGAAGDQEGGEDRGDEGGHGDGRTRCGFGERRFAMRGDEAAGRGRRGGGEGELGEFHAVGGGKGGARG